MSAKKNRTKKQKTKTRKNRTRSIYSHITSVGGGGLDFGGWFNNTQKKTHNQHKHHQQHKQHIKHNKSLHSNSGGFVLGKVSVSWCGHCQDLVSIWRDMKADKRIKNSRINVVDIDHESDAGKKKVDALNREHGIKIEVNGYPTIFKIYGRKLYYFPNDKERTADNIIKFAFQKH